MRKLRSLIAAFLVVLIQITPGPLGLRPAHAIVPAAALVPVAVGVLISGSLVAGADVYSQQVYSAANSAVDSVSGNISRSVLVAKMFGVGAEQTAYGVANQVVLGFQSTMDWVKTHTPDFPLLNSARLSASTPAPYTPMPNGSIINPNSSDSNQFPWAVNPGTLNVGAYGGGSLATDAACFQQFLGWGMITADGTKVNYSSNTPSSINVNPRKGPSWCLLDQQILTSPVRQTSAIPITYPPAGSLSPSIFATNISHSAETQAEIDKMIFRNPAAVISKPASFLPWQVSAAHAQAVAKAAQATAVAAESASAANPADIALQIAASQARAAADQAEIAVQGELAKSEAVEIEKAAEAEKASESEADIPYSPSGLAGPYTLPTVDFGARLQQFIDSAKSSSIFSLPGSVFGNVPGAGTSTMTINGGQIFGTHVFDFADMSGMWVVLRGIILTGFSFIAVRVVTLKR